jgi:hypothetical protein
VLVTQAAEQAARAIQLQAWADRREVEKSQASDRLLPLLFLAQQALMPLPQRLA